MDNSGKLKTSGLPVIEEPPYFVDFYLQVLMVKTGEKLPHSSGSCIRKATTLNMPQHFVFNETCPKEKLDNQSLICSCIITV